LGIEALACVRHFTMSLFTDSAVNLWQSNTEDPTTHLEGVATLPL